MPPFDTVFTATTASKIRSALADEHERKIQSQVEPLLGLSLGAAALDRVLSKPALDDTALALLEICKSDAAARGEVANRALSLLVGLLRCSTDAATHSADAIGWLFEEEGLRRGQLVVEAGAVPALVILLMSSPPDHEETAVQAACALANLAAELEQSRLLICDAGAILPLVGMLSAGASMQSRAAVCAARALANLAPEEVCRRAIEDAGALPQIMPLLGPGAKLGSERPAGSGSFKERTARHSRLKV